MGFHFILFSLVIFVEVNATASHVNGEWSPWTVLVPCSRTCGSGIRIKARSCNYLPRQYRERRGEERREERRNQNQEREERNIRRGEERRGCYGSASTVEACRENSCQVDGGWSSWTARTSCSKSCGGGCHQMTRECNNPPPSNGGRQCFGQSVRFSLCNTACCPVDGEWSHYSLWSPCSKSCGGGQQTRYRRCNSRTCGGANCPGLSYQTMWCNTHCCSVDGQWSHWESWGQCSRSCSTGITTRYRQCDFPSSTCQAKRCPGSSQSQKKCCNGRVFTALFNNAGLIRIAASFHACRSLSFQNNLLCENVHRLQK
eukprot:m.93683 g.93683  ORF g.93683 m.93683 type:complete len:315 (+) comp36795_c0_seq5:312-1256(+)